MTAPAYPPDERALLDAILADPDDDDRRLVYADWLEERGDSRAEWLRAEVELKQKFDRDIGTTDFLEPTRLASGECWNELEWRTNLARSPMMRLEGLRRRTPEVAHRVEFLPAVALGEVHEFECGVLCVVAFWSAPSMSNYEHVTRTLNELDPDGLVRLAVVDVDHLTRDNTDPPWDDGTLNDTITRGMGEAYWIRNGRIVAETSVNDDPGRLQDVLRQILRETESAK